MDFNLRLLYIIVFMTGMSYWSLKCGGLSCVDEVNVQQPGMVVFDDRIQVIVPRTNFSCSGRITGYLISLERLNGEDLEDLPIIQVYRPSMESRESYIEEDRYTLSNNDITNMDDYHLANVSFIDNDRIEFQSDDVIGYFIPSESRYKIWNIETVGYTSYIDEGSRENTFSINTDTDVIEANRQPLIQVIFDILCDNLLTPSNGEIASCSSGSTGMGYEGDTCSFTCNTGYELTGSPQRTCQSDGSWSGSPVSCTIMECPSSSLPMNSMLAESCSSRYQSMCDLQCEEGFNGSGDPSYVCEVLSDRSVMWITSGGGWSCERIQCNTSLSSPSNGEISCNSTGVPHYEDQCSFSCDPGYELTGSSTRQCLSNGLWSGADVTCDILHCNNLTNTIENSVLVNECGSEFGSVCSLGCETGYRPVGNNMFTCDSVNDMVVWKNIMTGENFQCIGMESSDGGGSAGAAVGGVLGGIVLIAAIIAGVLLVMLYMKYQRKAHTVNVNTLSYICGNKYAYSDEEKQMNNTMYKSPSQSQPEYEDPDYCTNKYYAVVGRALSSLSRTHNTVIPAPYEVPTTLSKSTVGIYEMESPSPFAIAESMEDDQQIYDTPCEDEEPSGPVYCKPPSDEHKIYEEFEGKRFRKIFHTEILTLEELGTGEFGVVNRGTWKPSSTKEVKVAIKTLNTDSTDKDRLRFLQEAAIMCQFDHENVIKLYGVVTNAPAMIILEYMSRGDLRNVLMHLQPSDGNSAHEKLPIVLLKFCQEIAAGMVYLSAKNFVHRDLAARNILVSESTTCKIADFGMSRNLLDENYYITSGGKIPVKWTAPEAIYYRKYSPYSDVWSYGCVLYEIWSLGCKPYGEMTNDETLTKLDSGYRLPPPPGCSRIVYRMMIKCWNPEPRSRPQFGQIKRLLASSWGYLLHWSDEDKHIGGEDAMKLGGSLGSAKDLHYDLQMTYKHVGNMFNE